MMMRKSGALAASFLMFFAAVNVSPRDSRAALGAAAVGGPLLYVGFAITALGSVGAMANALQDEPVGGFKDVLGAGVITWFIGVLLLDADHGTAAEFAAVTDADGAQAGLTSAEIDAYNQNIEELNAVAQAAGADSAAAHDFSHDAVTSRFDRYASSLPADAVSAAKKIASYAVRQAEAAR